jgi:hypothetical protein
MVKSFKVLGEELKTAIRQFHSAAENLGAKWNAYPGADNFDEYPFKKSFGEVIVDIKKWEREMIEFIDTDEEIN